MRLYMMILYTIGIMSFDIEKTKNCEVLKYWNNLSLSHHYELLNQYVIIVIPSSSMENYEMYQVMRKT